jgi:hypothetical protein
MPSEQESVLKKAYDAFNARDIETVLTTMHPDVDWPNAWEGGRVYGQSAVREYWRRQWGVLDPRVDPLRFHADESGRTVVDVHSVVRDRAGNIIADQMVQHVYLFEDGLIRRMEVRGPKP